MMSGGCEYQAESCLLGHVSALSLIDEASASLMLSCSPSTKDAV